MSFLSFVFISLVVMSPAYCFSSSEWVLAWGAMELAVIGLIPVLVIRDGLFLSSEACMKYFMIQSMASCLLLYSGAMYLTMPASNTTMHSLYGLIMYVSLLVKVGVVPFHFWVIPVMSYFDVYQMMLILGPMKVVPLCFLGKMCESSNFYLYTSVTLSMLSILGGSILGNSCYSVGSMIGASSINHTGWLVLAACYGGLWPYLVMYLMTISLLYVGVNTQNWLYSGIVVLSMGSLPPFLMFFAKLNLMCKCISGGVLLVLFIVVILSVLLSLKFYMTYLIFFTFNFKFGVPLTIYNWAWTVLFVSLNLIGGMLVLFYFFFYGWV